MKLLVMSCDKNEDLFPLFHHCIEKYWKGHPEVIYCTETIDNPYYKTIHKNYPISIWTKRVRECAEQIDDDYIILMCDDIFIREQVDNELMLSLVKYFEQNPNLGAINLQNRFDKNDILLDNSVYKRNPNGKFKTSAMCQLWKKDKLLQVYDYDTDPWKFEQDNRHHNFDYLITNSLSKPLLPFGRKRNAYNFGIVQGKWTQETLNFFESEGIIIDSAKRGVMPLSVCIGICSYFPWEQPERKQRQDRLDRLVKQLSNLFGDLPIIVIAQQWGYYSFIGKCKNLIIKYDYDKLGIIGARQELRNRFLESGFDYMIMFDDDAIIEYDSLSRVKEYLNEIQKHPKGFCFVKGGNDPYCPYADSQLNLCAVSEYIYSKEPIPNVNPQHSEAFEDVVFSTLLHYKYAELEFNVPQGLKCAHFKNPNIEQYGGEVPSTWATAANYDWLKLRDNTAKIKKYIAEHRELPDLTPYKNNVEPTKRERKAVETKPVVKPAPVAVSGGIDIVIPYVDGNDKTWEDEFIKHNTANTREDINAVNRFRPNCLLKYLFRSIAKNLPWINNVFLLVSSETQVPSWVNREKVKVVLHKDFIPQEYLPVFNSQAIEMFLHNIPNLGDRFLYANDDCLISQPMTEEEFYWNNKVYGEFTPLPYIQNHTYYNALRNGYKMILGKEDPKFVYEPIHGIRPYFKKDLENVFNSHKEQILNSITPFRANNNFNVFIYDYQLKKEDRILKLFYHFNYFSNTSNIKSIEKALNSYFVKSMCINDTTADDNNYFDTEVNKLLIKKFPEKCKYELLLN